MAKKKCTGGDNEKKLKSQRGRSSLGAELGAEGLQQLADEGFPKQLFKSIKVNKTLPLGHRGPHSCQEVNKRIYKHLVGKYGNLHIDDAACDVLGALCEAEFTGGIKPYGKQGTMFTFAEKIKNFWNNFRQQLENVSNACTSRACT